MPSHSLRKTVVQTHSAASEGLSNMEIQFGLERSASTHISTVSMLLSDHEKMELKT